MIITYLVISFIDLWNIYIVYDYTPFIKAWDLHEAGLKKFLITFLNESSGIAFQHIGVWTIEQFIEGGSRFKSVSRSNVT